MGLVAEFVEEFAAKFFQMVDKLAETMRPFRISIDDGKSLLLGNLWGDQRALEAFRNLTQISEIELTDMLNVLRSCDENDFHSVMNAFTVRATKMAVRVFHFSSNIHSNVHL